MQNSRKWKLCERTFIRSVSPFRLFSHSVSHSFIWVKRKFHKPWNDVRLSSVTESFWILILVWHGHHRLDVRQQQNRRAYNLSWESLSHFCKRNWKSDEFRQSMTRIRMFIIILWGLAYETADIRKAHFIHNFYRHF